MEHDFLKILYFCPRPSPDTFKSCLLPYYLTLTLVSLKESHTNYTKGGDSFLKKISESLDRTKDSEVHHHRPLFICKFHSRNFKIRRSNSGKREPSYLQGAEV